MMRYLQEECREWYCPMDTAALDSACIPILKTVETGTYQVRLTVEPEEENEELFRSVNSTNLTSSLLAAMFENEGSSKSEIIMIAGNQTEPRIFVIAVIRIHSAANRTSLFGKGHFNRTYEVTVGLKETLSIKVRLTTGVWVEVMTFPVWSVHMLDTNRNLYLPVLYVGDDVVNVYEYPTVDKLAFCLHVILDRHEYIDFISHVRIMTSGLELYMGEFIRMRDSRKLRVCYDDYVKSASQQLSQTQKATDYMEPQVIASIACTSMSISCLVITIFTYVIFSELRSIPGKNNILLAVHLLIAQCLYQFTFTRTELPRLCIAFGIFIHFFWLTAILWMSACTLHMFRVFVTKNRISSKHALDPQVCIYAIYCYVIASVAVAINIGVSLKRSNGKSIGYGGRICYISEPSMVGFTFALPVGIIVCLNIIFFVIVIYKISESTMRLRGGQSNDRYNAVIYMKLSSLTGATWIFGYLYIWTGFLPLEYIFIVLNAGQGVFIFVSFICNSKILRLYHELFRKYGRRLFRTICKENSKLPSRRQKPAEKKIVKTVVTSNKSEESNKSDTSSKSVPKCFQISSNPMPPCPTDVSPNNIMLAVNESKMGGGSTADTVPNTDALVGHM